MPTGCCKAAVSMIFKVNLHTGYLHEVTENQVELLIGLLKAALSTGAGSRPS